MAVKRIVWLTFIACLWLAATALISRGEIAKQVFTTGYIGHFSSTQTNDLRFKLPAAQGFGFLLVTTNGPPQGSVTIRSGQAEAIERFEPAQLIDALDGLPVSLVPLTCFLAALIRPDCLVVQPRPGARCIANSSGPQHRHAEGKFTLASGNR